MPEHADLLDRYKPHLVYDSQESYFADSSAEWTDAPGNVLMRADRNTVVAAATAAGAVAQLSLEFLGNVKYGNAEPVKPGDLIGHPDKNYLERYRQLHPQERYRNRMYGHAVEGSERLWLQYWFFYYYNDAPLKWIGYGKHEGDWEMIQLRLGDDSTPDLAVYAQHKEAGVREWRDVQRLDDGDTPVIYVARGAHASYFAPGHHWNDRADGGRPAPPLTLEIVEADDPAWIAWPGVWGDTQADSDIEGQSSPDGPCRHNQWADPDSLIPKAAEVAERPAPKAPPAHPQTVTVARVDQKAQVDYVFPGESLGRVQRLLVTVNSPDDHFPPATYELPIDKPRGTVEVPLPLEDDQHYEVQVSAIDEDGVSTSAVRRDLEPAG